MSYMIAYDVQHGFLILTGGKIVAVHKIFDNFFISVINPCPVLPAVPVDSGQANVSASDLTQHVLSGKRVSEREIAKFCTVTTSVTPSDQIV